MQADLSSARRAPRPSPSASRTHGAEGPIGLTAFGSQPAREPRGNKMRIKGSKMASFYFPLFPFISPNRDFSKGYERRNKKNCPRFALASQVVGVKPLARIRFIRLSERGRVGTQLAARIPARRPDSSYANTGNYHFWFCQENVAPSHPYRDGGRRRHRDRRLVGVSHRWPGRALPVGIPPLRPPRRAPDPPPSIARGRARRGRRARACGRARAPPLAAACPPRRTAARRLEERGRN